MAYECVSGTRKYVDTRWIELFGAERAKLFIRIQIACKGTEIVLKL